MLHGFGHAAWIWTKDMHRCRNADKKVSPASLLFCQFTTLSPASFRHYGQSGTTCHKLVCQCPAVRHFFHQTSIGIFFSFVFWCSKEHFPIFFCTVSGRDGRNRTRNIAVYTWRFRPLSYDRHPNGQLELCHEQWHYSNHYKCWHAAILCRCKSFNDRQTNISYNAPRSQLLVSCPLLAWSWRILILYIPSMSMIVIGHSLLY